MSRIFVYTVEEMERVEHALAPCSHQPSSKMDQAQVAELERLDFVPLWGHKRAQHMLSLGMLMAKTHCEGALWAYARAKWEDGLARWARREDVNFFETMMTALNGLERVPTEELGGQVERLSSLIGERTRLNHEQLQALESVARLGNSAAVLSFLVSL